MRRLTSILGALLAACGLAQSPDLPDAGADADGEDAPLDAGHDAFVRSDAFVDDDAYADDAYVAPDAFDAGPRDDAGGAGVGTGRSFGVTFEVVYPARAPSTLPRTFHGTLWLAPRADGDFDAVTAIERDVIAQTGTRDASGLHLYWSLARPADAPCSLFDRVRLPPSTSRLTLIDDDGDGIADRLTGTADGTAIYSFSDADQQMDPVTATMVGAVEHDAPTLSAYEDVAGHIAIDRAMFLASEPLRVPTSAWLETSDGTQLTLTPFGSNDDPISALIGLSTPYGTTLPFATTLTLHTSEPLVDLEGNPLAMLPPVIATLPIAAAVTSDGFESGSIARIEGPGAFVTSLGTLPAITGARSVLLPPPDLSQAGGSTVTSRITLAPGATAIHFRARYLARGPLTGWQAPPVRVRVYGLGALGSEATFEGPDPTASIATGDATWPYASNVVDVVATIPAGATGEVVVVIGERNGRCGVVPAQPLTSLLVDDVHAE